jgi:outer membrane protein OmpA-like peptidoglycan-associated protein
VIEEIVSEESARTSDEEFSAAPVAVEGGKKSGLSDLEKVGLLALGALVVGAIINEGKKDEKKVISNTGDRVVVLNPDGTYVVYKDDDAILRRPGVRTVTETYKDGSTRTVVQRADGTQVVTIRDASGRVLRRATYDRDGQEIVLFDDLYEEVPIIITDLPKPRKDRVTISTADSDASLKAELAALEAEELGRKFSLRQIREIAEVRALAATIEVDSVTFDSGSAAIKATEARKLADIGRLMQELLEANPAEVFLIEGHTDAVGSASSNLSLSDRRAESLALALTEYFDIPPENLVVQGYGESELKVETLEDERANRRVVVRLITPLMRTAEVR